MGIKSVLIENNDEDDDDIKYPCIMTSDKGIEHLNKITSKLFTKRNLQYKIRSE